MIGDAPAYMPTIVADKTTALFVVIGIRGRCCGATPPAAASSSKWLCSKPWRTT
ncbi:hypothetical protein HK414_22300 [Ramlibacter terrae]|uniref:Uncharacterized protein n=1 Tax=Ramlibacter terrae TaxID=2732511 RepID=A0ABX6P553_9BURK|nr:hypothetical protein HK414_22300 [Ramlibacter terrae]